MFIPFLGFRGNSPAVKGLRVPFRAVIKFKNLRASSYLLRGVSIASNFLADFNPLDLFQLHYSFIFLIAFFK